jgi:hypothetical protein
MSLIEDCAELAGAEPQTSGTGLMNNTIFVRLDVHKETIAVVVAEGERVGEVRQLGNFLNRPDHIKKLVQRLAEYFVILLRSWAIRLWPLSAADQIARMVERAAVIASAVFVAPHRRPL